MRLARLTGLERDKIVAEFDLKVIADLKDILNTPQRVTDIILEDIDLVLENSEMKEELTMLRWLMSLQWKA